MQDDWQFAECQAKAREIGMGSGRARTLAPTLTKLSGAPTLFLRAVQHTYSMPKLLRCLA